jgi:hypothetical protein
MGQNANLTAISYPSHWNEVRKENIMHTARIVWMVSMIDGYTDVAVVVSDAQKRREGKSDSKLK